MNEKELEISGWHELREDGVMYACVNLIDINGQEVPTLWQIEVEEEGVYVRLTGPGNAYAIRLVTDKIEAKVEIACIVRELDMFSENMIDTFKEMIDDVWSTFLSDYESNFGTMRNQLRELMQERIDQWD